MYGVTLHRGVFVMATVTSTVATPEQKRCFVFFGPLRSPGPVATLTMRTPTQALTGLPGLCLLCVSGAAGDVRPRLVFECAALASLRSMYLTDIGIVFVT